MNIDEKISVVEAILFSSGEPIDTERLQEAIEVDKVTLDKLIKLHRCLGIKPRHGLVKHQQHRRGAERPGQQNPLLLPARKLAVTLLP